MRVVGQRCRYQCVVKDVDGDPHFVVRVEEKGFEDVSFESRTPRGMFYVQLSLPWFISLATARDYSTLFFLT